MTATNAEASADAKREPAIARQIPLTLAILAAILAGFDLWSAHTRVALHGFGAGTPVAPPVYGHFRPGFSPQGALAIVAGIVAVWFALWTSRRDGVRPLPFLAAALALMFAFSASVVMIDGRPRAFVSPLVRMTPPDYHADAHLVHEVGVREFVREFPSVAQRSVSIHTATHPPGPVVIVAWLESAFPDHPGARAALIGFLGCLVLVPTFFIARSVAGERAAMVAVLLLMVAPSPVLHSFTSLDAVFATAMVTTVWLLMRGSEPGLSGGHWWRPFLGGLAVGLVCFLTYAAAFLALFGILYELRRNPWRAAVRRLAIAAAGGFVALAFLRLTFEFDLLACYRAGYLLLMRYPSRRLYGYWLFGNVAVWLTFAGLPIAALGLREFARKRPWYVLALLIPLFAFYAMPERLTHIIPGETERTLQFVYPLAAAAAASFFVRWERRRGVRANAWVASLVALAAAQTIAIEALYNLFW